MEWISDPEIPPAKLTHPWRYFRSRSPRALPLRHSRSLARPVLAGPARISCLRVIGALPHSRLAASIVSLPQFCSIWVNMTLIAWVISGMNFVPLRHTHWLCAAGFLAPEVPPKPLGPVLFFSSCCFDFCAALSCSRIAARELPATMHGQVSCSRE